MNKHCTHKSDARSSALVLLNLLDRGGKTLDGVLEDLPDDMASEKDRALMNAIVFGVLRRRNYIDHIIRHVSDIPLRRIDPSVMNILRIGLFQILFLDRVPESAAVNTAVELAKPAGEKAASFVNALLRNAIRKKQVIPFPDMNRDDPAVALSVTESFPEWMITRWFRQFGTEETKRLCSAMNAVPPVTIRTNTLKTTRDILADALRKEVDQVGLTSQSPEGITCSTLKRPVSDLPGYSAGWFQVQDEASQLISHLVSPKPGETVLDACAGLGGKSGHMAQLMQNRGEIAAFDIDKKKIDRLQKDMQRIGAAIIRTGVWDLQHPVAAPQQFDRILLDAPCSGLGVIRRNPDAKWRITDSQITVFQQKQVRFLNNLAALVKPSGVLVYAVCTMEPEETEAVIEAFLNRHTDFAIEPQPDCPQFLTPLITPAGYLRTYPHRTDTDGFFAARMKRIL